MPDYKSMYFALAAQVANAIALLVKAQRNGEESAMDFDSILEIAPWIMQHEGTEDNEMLIPK